jgi:hypothetical protein
MLAARFAFVSNARRLHFVSSTMKLIFVSALFCWLAIGVSPAQNTSGPSAADGTTNLLAVELGPQLSREVFHAPATVRLSAFVTLRAPAHAGDFVTVEFFANTNRLGSGRSDWHGLIRPQPRPGQPVPLFVIAPGFAPATFIWTNVPAGDYTLTARATGANGLSAVSAPVNIIVRP